MIIRSEILTENICSLWFQDKREGVTVDITEFTMYYGCTLAIYQLTLYNIGSPRNK